MSVARPYSRIEVAGGLAIVRLEAPRHGGMPGDGLDFREWAHRADDYARIQGYLRAARDRPGLRANQPGSAWIVQTGAAAIALAAATAKTLLYVNAGASDQPVFTEISVGFDGITSSAVPALVELVYGTKATNSTPGTASTSVTPVQQRGWPAQTPLSTAAANCTSEPTVLTAGRNWLVTPNGGLIILPFTLSREPTGVASGTALSGNQVGLRATAPAIVNTRGYVEIEE